jgi:hypothetical protein
MTLSINNDQVSKFKRQGHFIYQINYIVTNNGKQLTYFYNGDFRRELLPSNILLTKIFEENETKEKLVGFIRNLLNKNIF